MAYIEKVLGTISDFVWGPPLLLLLVGTHLFLTFRLGIVQRYIPLAIRLSLKRTSEGEGDISHFGALMTALAATIGTGNIVGVSTAVALGGPGAVLWMWLTGVFGIATKYTEALLSVHFRVKMSEGHYAGGPMYVLERGLNMKWLGMAFAGLTAVAAFGIGNMVQANSIAEMLKSLEIGDTTIHISPYFSGTVMMLVTALVILGGIRSIARVCEFLVPFMAIAYVAGCLVLLATGISTLPATVAVIVKNAFSLDSVAGGFAGTAMMMAMRYGVARGLFSNESGLGSAPIVAAAAQTSNPVRQALVSSTGTFWDTVVVCLMTGLVVVNSGEWMNGLKGAELTKAAFSDVPVIGPLVLALGLLTFVFSTILGWSYYGERAVEYLFGNKAVFPYRIAWVIAVFIGSVSTLSAVWTFADIANGLMAIPNLISLLLLSGLAASLTKTYMLEGKERHD